MLKRMMCFAVLLSCLLTLTGGVTAQSNEIILTISVNHSGLLTERILQGFYDTHPNVKIVPILPDGGEMSYGGVATSVSDIEPVLDKAQEYFSRSDILTISMNNIHPFATRAGYVLDMMPYIRADSETYDDFYPVALKMYQWDGGLWGLPMTLSPWFMTYDPTAFEAAGYSLPDDSWMLDDYLAAGRALTERDASGAVTQPGFLSIDDGYLLGPTLGIRFYDDSTQPEVPLLAQPAVEDMFTKLKTYREELSNSAGSWRYNEIPLQLSGLWRLTDDDGQTPYLPASLTGERVLIAGDGFAISAGTQHPDLAYEFIAYLTRDIEAVTYFAIDIPVPARRSLQGQSDETWGWPSIPEVIKPHLPEILENGVPIAELRYGEYLYSAINKVYADEPLTPHEALQEAQQEAIENLRVAEARRDKPLMVATPVPTPNLAVEEIAIKFLADSRFQPLPNRDAWESLANSFAETDLEVGHVELVTDTVGSNEAFQTVDCAYTSRNALSFIDRGLLQPFDPFLATDSEFDRSDIPDVLWSSVTRDGQIYALPMTLMPLMVWYNPTTFEEAGVPLPQNGWTISEFLDAMTQLKAAEPENAVFYSESFDNSSYLLLAAGLGGVVADYTTDPPTYHLTDPDVVEALRQTLDLARQGIIHYTQHPYDGSGGGSVYAMVGTYNSWDNIGPGKLLVLPVTFPRGEEIIPLSYTVGAGYITAHTRHAEVCYRWLSTVAQHPELFYDMPVRHSQANTEVLTISHGPIAADIYSTFFEMLNDPNAVFVPNEGSTLNYSPRTSIPEIWLDRVLDAYVLEDADLEEALTQVQAFIDEYQTCAAGIPVIDRVSASEQERQAYDQQFIDCGIDIDPSLRERFD